MKFIGLPLLTLTIVIIAFLGLFIIPPIARNIIDKQIALTNGSLIFPVWKDAPIPLYHKFYFYNVTNADQVEKHGAKPNLEELGPFTYRVELHKDPLIVNNNGTLSFREIKYWHFDRKLSVASEDTIITTINAPLVLTLNLMDKLSPSVRKIVDEALEIADHGFFVKQSIKSLTFTGYPDFLISFGPLIAPEATKGYNGNFGYFHPKNGTDDGFYTVHSGVGNLSLTNLLTRINGKDSLDLWSQANSSESKQDCNRFNDSTRGELFPAMRDFPTPNLKLYTSDMCRTFKLSFQKSHSIIRHLETWNYLLTADNFANPQDYPPNACYTSRLSSLSFDGVNSTMPSGIFDASSCKFGFPIFASMPHFLHADPYYLSKVNGLTPNDSLHSSWLEIEPISGSSAVTKIRLQINLGIVDSHLFKRNHSMPNIIFPAFWMELSSELTPDLSDKLILAFTVLSLLPTLIFHVGIAVASLILFIASLRLIIPKRRVKIHRCLSILTCNIDKSVKDDEQRILEADDHGNIVNNN